MPEAPYTTKDIIEKLGIPMQRLRMWLLNGFISPSIPSAGQGHKAYFSHTDFYAIDLFAKLLNKGFKRELAAKYVKSFQDTSTFDALQYASYLFFITEKSGEDVTVSMRSVLGEETLGLLFEPTKISMLDREANMETEVGEFLWEDVTVINFALLKGFVDAALK